MSTSLKFYTTSGLTSELTNKAINHNVYCSGDPQDFVFYIGSTNASNKFQKNSNPGVDALQVSIVNATAVWAASTAKVVNNTVRTTAKNGYRYKVQSITSGGLTGSSEPTWPTTVGATVVDNQVTWINDGKLHEATEIKLATSSGGLTSATAGAALSLGTVINGGTANAVAVYMRIDDATALVGTVSELSLKVLDVLETPL